MDYNTVRQTEDGILVEGVRNCCLRDIFESGQCFRWETLEDGRFQGVAGGRLRTLEQTADGSAILIHRETEESFWSFWRDYLDFGRDYGRVKACLSADPVMDRAIAFTPGMRVLRQDPWETLCSFIISANNNIIRIKGIVSRLCAQFGEPVEGGYGFPLPETLAVCTPEDLAPIRSGYRANYLIDAARAVATGALELQPLYSLPLTEARKRLTQVKGVGPKVAECVLLYGFARAECVPVDVWIRRALERLYPDGMESSIAAYAGLGQQYLFHYVRHHPDALS